MNIEMTAALAQWLCLRRTESVRYRRLVRAALHLPMPRGLVSFRRDIKSQIEAVARLCAVFQTGAAMEATQYDPIVPWPMHSSSFWRNSELENIHAGHSVPLPLRQRRITPAEEHRLLRTFATAYSFFNFLLQRMDATDQPDDWTGQVSTLLELITFPADWTLDEATRSVELWGAEPASFV